VRKSQWRLREELDDLHENGVSGSGELLERHRRLACWTGRMGLPPLMLDVAAGDAWGRRCESRAVAA
jgi:hypothetical protein